ncbi:MAG: hypothetical protein ACI8W7_003684 [Gammaproteobacteria bacterium]|jgi:hypothetical protein
MLYRVYIDANPHQMDTSTRVMHGVYDCADQAVNAAREFISSRLVESHRPAMSSAQLMEIFVRRGEMPFIMPEDKHSEFDRMAFVRERAKKSCWREGLRTS